ncbi:MAG: type II secretion system F family protein [Nanoarchaeota archaeon]|nr:type II secretion system F family protein [Nanoarchaeota archaeon]
MEIKKPQLIAIIASVVVIGVSFIFLNTNLFFLLIGIGVLIGVTPFIFQTIYETKVSNEKEEMFLEFTRNLVESVRVGTPISKSIINIKGKSYGVLSENVNKLANQISLGIPLHTALQVFARDVNNRTVSRALTLIGEAERAGGDIGEILEAVAESVRTSDKLKKERKATISTLVVQGYIIFFIFMAIILVMQFKILPLLSGIAESGGLGIGGLSGASGSGSAATKEISSSFLWLLLVQGFFSGLTIGKMSEGNIKSGLKHSFALMVVSFLVSAGANLFIPAG